MIIRPALESDAARVFLLLQQLEQGYAPDREAFEDNFAFLVDDENTSMLLVSEDAAGQVLGYALTTITPLLHTNGSSAQLQELVVDSEHHGAGIGTALVEEVERLCRDRGVKQLTVPSRRSAAFYERIGYRSTADFLKRTF
jgi:GNAT superfamily N-acetyltransferase